MEGNPYRISLCRQLVGQSTVESDELLALVCQEPITVKITTVLYSKLTKSVGYFEENKFSVGGHQFLLGCCPKLIKTYNFGQNAVNERQFKNKNEQYCGVRLFN